MRGGAWGTFTLLLLAGLPLAIVLPTPVSGLTTHAPIVIEGDAAFTAANGVVAGTGSAADPYVLEGWDIDVAFPAGIEVRNTRAHFLIRNSAVHSGAGYPGLRLVNVWNGRIENVTFRDNAPGIHIEESQDLTFVRNTLAANFDDVIVLTTTNTTFSEGLHAGASGSGFYIRDGVNVTLSGNRMDGARETIGVEGIVSRSSRVRVENNWLRGASGLAIDGWRVDGFEVLNNTISQSEAGLRAMYATAVEMRNNVIEASRDALEVAYSAGATIAGNAITGVIDSTALYVHNTNNATVDGNQVEAPASVIWLYENLNLTVKGNSLSGLGFDIYGSPEGLRSMSMAADNTVQGMPFVFARDCSDMTWDAFIAAQYLLVDCQRVVIRNQTFLGLNRGITLASVQDVLVEDVTMTNMAQGIALTASWSSNLTIRRANFTANQGYGAAISSSANVTITDSTFWDNFIAVSFGQVVDARVCHNNFVKNWFYPSQVADYEPVNSSWDDGYPSGGNYWSHYPGPDRCSGPLQNVCAGPDGIGDTSLSLQWPPAVDRYPVIRPFGLTTTPPVAAIDADRLTIEVGESIQFDGGNSYDTDGSVVEYTWDFGDGTTGNGSSTSHVFVNVDSYTVFLTVRDNAYEFDSASVQVWVIAPQVYPMLLVTGPQPLYAGQAATFDARGSYTTNGTITQHDWDFGDGTTATGALVQHAFLESGTYAVQLIVTSSWGVAGSGTREVTVLPIPEIPLRPYEHRLGFRVPIPTSWSLTEDEVIQGLRIEAVLRGPTHDGFGANLILDTEQDPDAREDNAYLRLLVDRALRDSPSAVISEEPAYRTIAGQAGVVFGISRVLPTGAMVIQRMAIIVSADHARYWGLLLSAHAASIFLYNTTFQRMIDGFEITLASAGVAMVGVAAIVGVAIAVLVAVAMVSRKRNRNLTLAAPLVDPGPAPPGGSSLDAFQFCSACGTRSSRSDRFCMACGSALTPPPTTGSGGPTPPDSRNPPAPPLPP